MKLATLVETSRAIAGTRSRLRKRALIRDCLRGVDTDEIRLVVSYLGGTLPQGRIGIGPAVIRDLGNEPVADAATLGIRHVDATFADIARIRGQGSQARRRAALGRLFAAATAVERDFLARLILGELRQGALEGVLIEGIAEAADIPADEVRRAVMLAADPARVAAVVLEHGAPGLAQFRLEPLSPVQPMLAQPAAGVDEAMAALGVAALEYKLDGARVQIHRAGDEVRIFSRALNDVTARLPEIVEATLGLPADTLILDGEVIAMTEDARPLPFQVTMRRFGRTSNVAGMREKLPLSAFLFDCLHVDGETLIDSPYAARSDALDALADTGMRVPRLTTDDAVEAAAFLSRALGAGHEGIMAKSRSGSYAAGSRGSEWLKIKQAHTLDLVVLAAEWGSGRREGWLSNLHLGARNPADGTFVMLGKTFKGLTDRMLEWQTKRLLELELGREDHVVHVRPELVAEIAVNEIQHSPQYPAGMALRFARVRRYRRDKRPDEADTIETVRQLFARQSGT
jgi:DNA ligase-1